MVAVGVFSRFSHMCLAVWFSWGFVMNRLYLLIAFLGTVGLGLFWLSGVIDDRVEAAREAGKAECVAEQAKKVAVTINQKEEVKIVQDRKAAIVWSRPGSRLPALIERMREKGIGTGADISSGGCVSGRRC